MAEEIAKLHRMRTVMIEQGRYDLAAQISERLALIFIGTTDA